MCEIEKRTQFDFSIKEQEINLSGDINSLLEEENWKITGISSEQYLQTLQTEKKIPAIIELLGKRVTLFCKNEVVDKEVPFEPPKATSAPLHNITRIDGVLSCISRDGLVLQRARGFRKINLMNENETISQTYLDPIEIGGIVVSPCWIDRVLIQK